MRVSDFPTRAFFLGYTKGAARKPPLGNKRNLSDKKYLFSLYHSDKLEESVPVNRFFAGSE